MNDNFNGHHSHELPAQLPQTTRGAVVEMRYPRTAPPPDAVSGSVSDVVALLRRWGWQCFAAGIVLAVFASAVAWFTFRPEYEASAWLLLKGQPEFVAFAPGARDNLFVQTQLETIRSPIVVNKVLTENKEVARLPEILEAESPQAWMKKHLRVRLTGQSELCEITVRAYEPEAAVLVANAVLDAYLFKQDETSDKQTADIIALLNKEKETRLGALKALQDNVRGLARAATGNDIALIGDSNNLIIQQNPVAGLEEQQARAIVDRTILEATLKVYQEAVDAERVEVPEYELNRAIEGHPQVQLLSNQLAALNLKLREHRRLTARGDKDPDIRRMEKQILSLEEDQQNAENELRPKLLEQMKQLLLTQQKEEVAKMEAQIRDQLLVERIWQEQIEKKRAEMEKLGDKSLDLQFAREDLSRATAVYQKIADRIVALETEMKAPKRAAELLRASTPQAPLEALPYTRCAMAFLGALGIPFVLAFGWERIVRPISDIRRLCSESNLTVLGEITALPTRSLSGGGRSADRFRRDRITYEESIDSLRVGLTLAPELQDLRSIVVTSAISREGKTSLASSLAVSLARCTREPLLLVDADMRAPDLHDMFGISLGPGLAEVLAGDAALDEALIKGGVHGIHLLPAGRLKVNPHVLLRDGALRGLLDELRRTYRYMIVDAPPVLAASEALVIANSGDGAVVCTMRDYSRGGQLRSACEKLQSTGVRVLGAVMTGVPSRTWAHKYGGYGYAWDRYTADMSSFGEELSR